MTFAQLEGNTSAKRTFKKLNTQQGTSMEPAIICVNDDVSAQAGEVKKQFVAWMESKWPRAPEWEG